jgi:hypothetical protein
LGDDRRNVGKKKEKIEEGRTDGIREEIKKWNKGK